MTRDDDVIQEVFDAVEQAEKEARFEYEKVKTRCIQGLGIERLTFNRMVTDLTLHGIQNWIHRLKAAQKIQNLGAEAFRAGHRKQRR